MKKRILSSLVNGLLATSCFLVLTCTVITEAAEEVDVVINKSNSLAQLSLDDARKIFMGDKTVWPNGKHITVMMLAPGQPERAAIVREIYKMNEADYDRYFLEAAFTGRVSAPPKEVRSAVQMKQLLAQNPGAIGYLKKSDVDDSVKVILKLP
jgi:ABC-type phosphate transport system substrate-binding protein